MAKYFDKDFFRFLSGFIIILLVSITIVFLARSYEAKVATEEVPVIHTAKP